MVQNFIEESNEKQPPPKCGRNRCNCFHGNSNDSSDDELDIFGGGFGDSISSGSFGGDASDNLKSLIPCVSVSERNLLADTARIVEANKNLKQKDDLRKIVADGLQSLGYDSSTCKSKWEKSSSFPAGEYEYSDVMVEGDRLLIDIDFRSEFEVARSTGVYKAVLQSLPYIFVGKSDRLDQIVSIVSEAAKQSLKKKGMHFPPWRKAEYIRAKWLSPCTRTAVHRPEKNARQGARIKAGVGDVEYMDGRWVNTGVLKLVVEDIPSRHPPLILPPPPCSFFFLLLLQAAHLILPICQASASATSSSTRTSIAVLAPQWKLGQPLLLRHLSSSAWVFTHKPRLA
ncbi:uncharacterized protein [Malus domestica]|uniref:uncharacterized protein n=1 Tax=Malus domestica TaxID=3750 RepID=UPI003977120E